MDNPEYKILLKENSEKKNGYFWSLQEENKGKTIEGLTPWKVYLSFSLKELLLYNWIDICTSFDEETSIDKEETEESGVIHATLNLEDCISIEPFKSGRKLLMFGTNSKINDFYLRINITKNSNEIAIGTVEGSTRDSEASKDFSGSISIRLFLKPKQFNYISDLIKNNRLERLELVLDEPQGFYSSANSDFIKVLTNSKEHEIIIPDNCKINPPRLSKTYFSIRAIRQDKITEEHEENNLLDDRNENIQEYKQIIEKILKKLDRIENVLAFPLWMIFVFLGFLLFFK
ncbi:hypothetical protein [Legionella cherrii]|uniref:Ankyrin repeat protein n=1 Tax=Legionella cherrii TaxID=28084 RepID=A0ABY6T4X0_9GAMM|nr:hypothetical protein [Legionella cherrii]VEB35533.1 Uncharacterised protein [Legionella cherrii]